jgi:hypothetical protein
VKGVGAEVVVEQRSMQSLNDACAQYVVAHKNPCGPSFAMMV